jgi:hypothetical protein
MMLDRLTKECPGLAGSLTRLYGREVAEEFSQHYAEVADRGGNDELGVVREDGVSFNPRIARLVSLVIQDCDEVTPRVLRATVYSALPDDVEVPQEVLSDVADIRGASRSSPVWILCIALARMLDCVRHLHMAELPTDRKEELLASVASSALLLPGGTTPENLRLKVIHAVDMQRRRIKMEGME